MNEGNKKLIPANDNKIISPINLHNNTKLIDTIDPIQNLLSRADGATEVLIDILTNVTTEVADTNKLTQARYLDLLDWRNELTTHLEELKLNATLLRSAEPDDPVCETYASFLLYEIMRVEELLTGTTSKILPISTQAKMTLREMFGDTHSINSNNNQISEQQINNLATALDAQFGKLDKQRKRIIMSLSHQKDMMKSQNKEHGRDELDGVHIATASLEQIKAIQNKSVWFNSKLGIIESESSENQSSIVETINKHVADVNLFLGRLEKMSNHSNKQNTELFTGDRITNKDTEDTD